MLDLKDFFPNAFNVFERLREKESGPFGSVATLIVIAILSVWQMLVYLPIINPIGYEKGYSEKVLPIPFIGKLKAALPIGLYNIYLLEGQNVVFDYDVKTNTGSLVVRIKKLACPFVFCPILPGEKAKDRNHVTKSSSGQIVLTAPESGMYLIKIRPWRILGEGKKIKSENSFIDYSVKWKIE